jgi:AAA domain
MFTSAQRAQMDEEGARTRAEMDDAVDAELGHNRGVNDELRKLRYRTEARRLFNAEQAADRPQVQAVDGASFLLNQPDTVPCIWGTGSDVLWAEGEPLMICGLPGVGKTTIGGQVLRARLGIGDGLVLGLPVTPDTRPILYLAMDRPQQIRRALGRIFGPADHDVLRERLIVRPGPPPEDLAVNTDLLAQLADDHGTGTVFLDSLKDAALGLSEDGPAAAYNRARQTAIAAGIELLEAHHMVKRGAAGGKPKTLADVYGSTWLTAGAGSVIVLNGDPGDAVVELRHLKQPAAEVGPWSVLHDPITGLSSIFHATDLVSLAAAYGDISAKDAAKALAETDKPTPNDVEKARRKLTALVKTGHLIVSREGNKSLKLTTLWEPAPRITAPITAPSENDHFTRSSWVSRQNTNPQARGITAPITGITQEDLSRTPPPLEGEVCEIRAPQSEEKEENCTTCDTPMHWQRSAAGKTKCTRCEATA